MSAQLNIYSTANMANIANITMPYYPTDYVFIRNGTVMIVAVQSTQTISFYNVTSPTSYKSVFNLSAPSIPNTLYRVNDTSLYMATNMLADPIYTLTYNISTNSWIWGNLSLTKPAGITVNFQSAMDPCGRLWVSVAGYGIRIFDTYGTNLLYSWPVSILYAGIALSKQFDFYATDWLNGKVVYYPSRIGQCTS